MKGTPPPSGAGALIMGNLSLGVLSDPSPQQDETHELRKLSAAFILLKERLLGAILVAAMMCARKGMA